MKKCYIGLGGIGCRSVLEMETQSREDELYIYIDSDKGSAAAYPDGRTYLFEADCFKDEANAVISFVEKAFEARAWNKEEVDVVFATSSCGSFGAAIALEAAEDITGWLYADLVIKEMKAAIVAFSHKYLEGFLPSPMYESMKRQTAALVSAYRAIPEHERVATLRVVYSEQEEKSSLLRMDDAQLAALEEIC